MALTQMNVRIEQSEKALGDRVFCDLGYSSSQVVRAVWRFAAVCADDPQRVERALHLDAFGGTDVDADYRAMIGARAQRLVDDFAHDRGWAAPAGGDDDWCDLKEVAYLELWTQKGLIE